MYRAIVVFLLLGISGCALQLSRQQNESLDQQVVRESFNAYKYALLNDLGKEASDLVSARTIDYYGELLDLALKGDEKTIKQLPGFDRMVVLSIRHTLPAEDLVAITPRELFAYGVKEEWISKQTIAPFELGSIGIFGNYASANILRGTQGTNRYLEFRRENGVWRLNLIPLIEESKQQFAGRLNKVQGDHNKAILELIEKMSGSKVNKSVWSPILETGKDASSR